MPNFFARLSSADFDLAGVQGEDVAEAFDEVFFDGGAVALKEAERVGSFSPVEDGALDVALVAYEEQWQAVLGDETRALGVG